MGLGKTSIRQIFHVDSMFVNMKWLENELLALGRGQELAIHSRVTYKGQTYHIPQIDFLHKLSIDEVYAKTAKIKEGLDIKLRLFSSGKSLHGYFFGLIDNISWYRYLGELLLCNPRPKMGKHIIDSRWVGHSLKHGFSALRWSHNTQLYKSFPQSLDYISTRTL
jgi:hypothetical protein